MGSLRGKRVVITGGSAGIGLALAHALARRGARLGLIARDPARLAEAAAALAAHGQPAAWRACDVTDAPALARAIDELAGDLGGIGGVVANSGHCHPGRFDAIDLADADRQIDVNFKGVVYTLRHVLPILKEQGGGFAALTSSPAGFAPIYGFSLYGATKAALNSLAEALRRECADHNIAVHLLLPPDTDTPGYAHEVTLYPPETRAILAGGGLHPADRVAEVFARAIGRGQPRATVGWETRLLLLVIRFAPRLWDAYTRHAIRRARRRAP